MNSKNQRQDPGRLDYLGNCIKQKHAKDSSFTLYLRPTVEQATKLMKLSLYKQHILTMLCEYLREEVKIKQVLPKYTDYKDFLDSQRQYSFSPLKNCPYGIQEGMISAFNTILKKTFGLENAAHLTELAFSNRLTMRDTILDNSCAWFYAPIGIKFKKHGLRVPNVGAILYKNRTQTPHLLNVLAKVKEGVRGVIVAQPAKAHHSMWCVLGYYQGTAQASKHTHSKEVKQIVKTTPKYKYLDNSGNLRPFVITHPKISKAFRKMQHCVDIDML